jgi:hypothetical protein
MNGVEQQRFGAKERVVVRDAIGHAEETYPVGTYSPRRGFHVDRVGDTVHVTARLEVSGEDASPEQARILEERIRRHWNRQFPDAASVVTDVTVTYRPPGSVAAADASQIVMEKTAGASQVSNMRDTMYLNTSEPNATEAAPHEFGHLAGLGDRYTEPVLSRFSGIFVGPRWGYQADAGYEGNLMAGGAGPISSQNVRDFARENAPTPFSTDNQVRDWMERHDADDMAVIATTTKVRMVNSLMDGWISDQDVTAIESICATARPGRRACRPPSTRCPDDHRSVHRCPGRRVDDAVTVEAA